MLELQIPQIASVNGKWYNCFGKQETKMDTIILLDEKNAYFVFQTHKTVKQEIYTNTSNVYYLNV